jgi:Tol biopolymer transport system component
VNLWRIPVAGGQAEALTTGSGEDLDPTVSPDGRTLFFANVKRTWALVVQDVQSNTQRIVLEQRRPLAFPRYSPDGSRIALMGRSSRGEMQLLVTPADRPEVTTVTDGRGELNIMPQWSGDGKTLYYYQVRPAATFRTVALTSGVSSEVAPWAFARQFQAAVDPGQRAVVYSLVEDGYLKQSRVRDLETGAERVLPFALYEQRFSRDGRLIAGESRDHELVVCQTETNRCRTLTPQHERPLTMIAWSGDGTRIFFLRHTPSRVWGELSSVPVGGGPVTEHGNVGPFERDFQMSMDVSPRDEIVFPIYRESPHELWLARLR